VRVGYLSDSNLIARRIGPIHGRLVASPDYVEKNGAPETPEELLAHEALMQGMETWQFIDGDKTIAVYPRGGSKQITAPLLRPPRPQGLALPRFLIASSGTT
jgi:DNA-binding transcriptional LysR family regulator